jgi:tetratricopeptide (TPR) repeat protein
MRSVEVAARGALAAAALALAGCASLPALLREPLQAIQQAVTGGPADAAPTTAPTRPAMPTPAERAAAQAGSAPAPVVVPPRSDTATAVPAAAPEAAAAAVAVAVAVSPAVQQAFDAARRDLAAGRSADAELAFRSLAQAHPELGGPQANLGIIYRQAGKLPEALAAFEKTVAASPRQAVYFNQLGVTLRQAGQFAKAREAYEQAIEINPEYPAPHLNLGILFDLYLWDGKQALELYDRYLALTPNGDAQVTKWVADLKNRKPQLSMLTKKEQP